MSDISKLQEAAKIIVEAAASNGMASGSTGSSEQEDPKYITINQACEIAGVSRWTVTGWLKKMDDNGNYLIRWIKLGSAQCSPVRIDKASFMAYLESMVQQSKNGKEVKV